MPNPTTNFKNSFGTDLGNILITKEYLMSVYPQIAANMITPELWVWGYNVGGELGDNTVVIKSIPATTSAGGANWKQVGCASRSTAAIKTDGTLWTWGFNNSTGQLGDNTVVTKSTPVTTFSGGTNWKQAACGGNHTAAIKTDGTLWTWGFNTSGQLGDNTAATKSIPVQVFGSATNWKQVAGGGNHTAAIKTDGTLWTWGSSSQGQLGVNDTTQRNTPVQVFGSATNWKQVSCGSQHTAAIKTDGTLWAWGYNLYGALGDNTGTNKLTPVQTSLGGTNWKQVSCFCIGNTTAAIKTDGTLWIWGRNSYGGLGNNIVTTSTLTPVTTFSGGSNWKQVSCGSQHTAAIKTDGTLWAWGLNSYGRLGINNATSPICTPVTTFTGGTNWKQVSCGQYHTVAIRTSDDLLGI